jgi:hypothetical protein
VVGSFRVAYTEHGSYSIETNYMYTLGEKFCTGNPVISLFLLFNTGNGCGYVNNIYDSEGELVRSILFPKPLSGFKLYRDLIGFIIFLFFAAAVGMVCCSDLNVKRHKSVISTLDNKKF